MSWALVPLPADLPIGFDIQSAVVGTQLHVLAGRPAGDAVQHLALGPDGGCEVLPVLPLAAVTGAVAGPDGLVLTGARIPDRAAVVQAWPELPVWLADEVAVWPVPVAGDRTRVAWATGEGPATVWLGELTHQEVDAEPVLRPEAVYGIQAVGRGDQVDLLCETAAGARLVHAAAGPAVESAAPSGALLSPGFLLTPGEGEIARQSTESPDVHRIRLPDWPVGQRRRISRLTFSGDLLCWTTERVDEPTDPEPLGWVARLDPAGALGPARALPYPGQPAAVHLLDGQVLLLLQPVHGRLQIWRDRAEELEVPATRSRRGFPIAPPPAGVPTIADEIVAQYRDDDPSNE